MVAATGSGFAAGGGTGTGLAADLGIAGVACKLVGLGATRGLGAPPMYDQVTGNRKVARISKLGSNVTEFSTSLVLCPNIWG